MIALIIIGLILMVVSMIAAIFLDHELNGLFFTSFMLGLMIFTIGADGVFQKEAEIRCLNGNFKYEQQFVYRLNDTIPSDTIYVKIK